MPRPRPATSSASRARGRRRPPRRLDQRADRPVGPAGAGRDGRVEPGPAQDRLLAGRTARGSPGPAGAGGPVRLKGGVAELAGVPVGAPEQLAGDDDAGPDPDLAGDVHVVAEGGPVPEPQLAEGGQVGLVLDQDRGARRRHPAGEQPAQRDVAPAEVGGAGHRARLLVDQAGHGHAGGRDGQALGRGRGHRGPGQAGQQLGHGRRVAGPVVADLDELDPGAPGQVDHAGGQVVDVDLQAQPGQAVAGQGEGGARPAKVAAALGALLDHQAGRASSSVTMLDTDDLVRPVRAASWARVTGSRRATASRTRARFRSRISRGRSGRSPDGPAMANAPSWTRSSLLERSNRIPGVQSSHPATTRSFGARTKVITTT